MKRRDFIKQSAAITGGITLTGIGSSIISSCNTSATFKISLAEWSLHRSLQSGDIDHLDFYSIAKNEFGISAVEYVNSFFFDKAKNLTYLQEMKTRADDLGVKSLLIMCDNEGNLGDPDNKKRAQAVENHYKWAEAAKFLGCHSIRVNARSSDYAPGSWPESTRKLSSFENQLLLAADGLQKLVEFCDQIKINTIVENHGGLSSNGEWLSAVMDEVNHPRIGTLPDFGNFRIENNEWYDRYKGVSELMPYAKAVSAKSHEFDENGNETGTDYYKMMKIVLDAGYNGYVGIEYEGTIHSEMEGIRLTLELLKKVREKIA
ncbi:MAG: sugar phosphate isomerase/epimerase family protein [Candidatus Marinimicrobia bacterium]|jgi:sugar phosphate isomerase/epimerase|nr:sugar phosphate isomerase/epimerase family protein [Candidatus Neomarinimicrobiota bacterium]MDP6610703.1 sugar phosphate isomerase/epimerase family protein [Candidatus Neomarinimicrobiota bacterium]|tara:strand:- start:5124 stop:6077 length:954 start_codon:yes stop_codon:yes gene_type:complete